MMPGLDITVTGKQLSTLPDRVNKITGESNASELNI